MIRNNLFIVWHLGLGDVIICAPIVRRKALDHELVVIPVKHHNVPSAAYLFRDLANVEIRGVCDDAEMVMVANEVWPYKVLNLGGFGDKFDGSKWDQCFYAQAEVPFGARYDEWKCERNIEAETNVARQVLSSDLWEKTAFIHQDPSRGMMLKKELLPVGKHIEPDPKLSSILFHWRTVIEACDEIHCISSSFAHFIDSIPLPKKPKKFLHAYTRPGEPLGTFREWEILQ